MSEFLLQPKFNKHCNKRCYGSRKLAKAALKEINMREGFALADVYFCDICSNWHTTSVDKKRCRKFSRKGNQKK